METANRERIETWEVLKKELKDQFPALQHELACKGIPAKFEAYRDGSVSRTYRQPLLRADRLGDYKVPNEPEQRSDDSGDERPRAGCFICGNLEHRARDCPKRGRLNAIVAEHTDSEQETGPARVGAMQLGTLQVQSRGCGEAHPKGLVMVPGRINGKEIKALVDTGATHNFVSDRGRPKAGAGRPNVGQSGEGCELKSGARGDKPSFVKGEYDGGTEAGKKSGVAEARSSNASSSKEGAQSPRLAGFSCIGTMQEEMHKRWTKAQQICGAEPETFTCEEMLKRERECEVGHSMMFVMGSGHQCEVLQGRRKARQLRRRGRRHQLVGVVCKTLESSVRQACALDSAASDDGRRHGHMRESADGLLACVGVMARGWCTAHGTLLGWSRKRSGVVRTGCAARGRAGLASVVSVGRRARAWASRRPCAETFGRLCARARAGADGSRQAGRRLAQDAPDVRENSAGRRARTGSAARAQSAGRRLSAAAKAWWLAANAEA
ncbi:UNVERIFIED_CONTAM: hypothetical protein Sangu_0194200 [Sesamum angustifolium]|uniref:CCHC-type domain-containing protein n=1 Tax=Sesamum angustifolium TaxID=2727405 RepID=A0AAW2RMP6_9LAMI